MNTITIKSKQHNYDVIVYEKLEELLLKNLNSQEKYFVIIDNKISDKYSSLILKAAPNSIIYSIEGGESAKTIEKFEVITSMLLENNFSKNDKLIAFGGGTITDLTGYIASTYKRGINFINIPTTTLAMIDASVGGKNAINVGTTKNAIGTIYPPVKVLVGLDSLETLDERNYNNGLFEALKMGMILDKELFDSFLANTYKQNIKDIIVKSIMLKKQIVEMDENENGIRKILNFGHTIGHAIELETNLLHGEAIANGMLLVSYKKSFYNDLKTALNNLNCPIVTIKNINEIKNDKKVSNNKLDLIVVEAIGKAEIVPTDLNEIERMVNDYVI